MKYKYLILFLLLPLVVSAFTVEIPAARFEDGRFISEMPTMLTPGEPALPYFPIQILLPMGQRVTDLEIIPVATTLFRDNVELKPNRQMQPISQAITLPAVAPSSLYNKDEFHPQKVYNNFGTQRISGYEILNINLYPYQYNPGSQEIRSFSSVEINLQTEFSQQLFSEQNLMLKNASDLQQALAKTVVNPAEMTSYRKQQVASSRNLADPENPFEMIVITDAERAEYLQEFVEWKNESGMTTGVFLTSDIYDNYEGVNNQQKIKNFITDAYQTYAATETNLEYVLLGGDDEIVPIRTVFIDTGYMADSAMPADLYYGCLDNDWDENGNGIYAEVEDNPDLLPEVTVGRFPAETALEFDNIFRKTKHYVEESTISNDIFYSMGENLNWDPVTWGGDYMDEVLEIVPEIEAGYHHFTRYQRENNYNSSLVRAAINDGLSAMNHMGHANETMVFGITSGTAHNLVNQEYGFAYTQGCYPAAFDEMTSQESEAVGENLVIANSGLYAFIGNTRYGWYSPGNTEGPSQPYDIEFFRAIYSDEIRELGKALDQSRVVMIGGALEDMYLRWVHYQLVLFGDPSVAVKQAVGGFPYLVPQEYSINDQLGDNDGQANPGETIELEIALENLAGWSDAEAVTASLEFSNPLINVQNEVLQFGAIAAGNVSETASFVIDLPQNIEYGSNPFNLTITAPVGEESIFQKTFQLDFSVSLYQANWPWHSEVALRANPIISKSATNNDKNILAVDSQGSINLLNFNAEAAAGFPLENELDLLNSTAFGDIDGDGENELVLNSRNGEIEAYTAAGELIFSYDSGVMQVLTPLIVDIDGDGENEIISYGLSGEILALTAAGTIKDNFPITIGEISFVEMAAADLNQDGAAEILVATSSGNLYVYQHDGELLAGFPYAATAAITSAPIVLDNQNIAFGTADNQLHLLQANGEIIFSKELSGEIASGLIAADFSDDATLELAGATKNGEIFIVDQAGEYWGNWPQQINKNISNSPLAADIDNDDSLELILFTNMNDLYCFASAGELLPFTPVPMNISGNSPASLEDLDNDGDFEFVSANSDGLFVIDCKLPKGDKIPWNTYRGNYQRTGYYGDNTILTASEDNEIATLPPARLHGNFPNPFNPTTTIAFSVQNDHDFVELEVFNIKGQSIKKLAAANFTAGRHNVVWSGQDRYNKQVASGIYLYKMSVNGKTIAAQKMLMLK
ncbi:MAG: C25 family cysteine peptidase [Candidatus Cloacimonadales bacterium]